MMGWINVLPENTGGGRKRNLVSCRITPDGSINMSHAVADMLGCPPKVRVRIDPEEEKVELSPSTPEDSGAFSFSGGGNASYRVRAKAIVAKWPHMVGEYGPRVIAGGKLLLTKLAK